MLRATLLFLLLAATLRAEAKPNIIYVLLDDAGYGDLSCYGQTKFSTPNMDRLATEGIKFTQHYSGSTVCAPTRSVLMTGMHTGHTPVRGNKEIKPVGQEPLPADTFTIAEALKEQGYGTSAFGKWGLGFPGSEGDPIHQGFDRFFGYNCQRNAHTYRPTWLFSDLQKIDHDGVTYAHDTIQEAGMEWLRARTPDQPFFCYFPILIPHAAMDAPEEVVAPFRKKWPEFEDKVGHYGGTKTTNPVAQFAGMMTRADQGVGEILALLKENGLDENTIVMLSSDNGPHQEGGHQPKFFDSNGPHTGFKRSLTEGGVRCPMLVRWPGRIAPGTTTDLISAHWDVFPTLCEIAGAPIPDNVDGISFLPTLLGKQAEQKKHRYLYWEFSEKGGKRASRFGKNGRWKAIQLDLMKTPPGEIKLFDLENDPAERKNVAEAHPELVGEAAKIFEEAHTPSEIWKFPFD